LWTSGSTAMEGVVRLHMGLKWLGVTLLVLAVAFVLWLVLVIAGCGSGSTGVGVR